MFRLAAGGYNTGLGWVALYSNIFGSFNTAVGSAALLANTASETRLLARGRCYSTALVHKTRLTERSH